MTRRARLRRWRHAGLTAWQAAALGFAAGAMPGAGRSHKSAGVVLIDAALDQRRSAR